jgi:thioredoxin reductase (NADPH)
VVVVGGVDAAVKEALFLTKFATKVYIVHRRDQLRAEQIIQERARRDEKMEFIWDTVVTEIVGRDNVTGVRLKNLQSGQESLLPAEGVFIYVGNTPNTALFEGKLELDEERYIVTDSQQRTSVPGVFAAGDVQEGVLRQIATAVGTGAKAAMEAERYIAELEDRAYPEWKPLEI